MKPHSHVFIEPQLQRSPSPNAILLGIRVSVYEFWGYIDFQSTALPVQIQKLLPWKRELLRESSVWQVMGQVNRAQDYLMTSPD